VTRAPLARLTTSSGEIEYLDTGGTGPTIVLLHGLLMDETLWAAVVEELAPDHRCVVPVLPLGAHRLPVADDFEISTITIVRLVVEILERLDLRDVTLVGNDTGGAIVQVLATEESHLERVGRIVLASCDAFDNFPPGLTGKTIVLAGMLPPRVFGLFMQQLRLRPIRRLPIAFGWLTRRGDATCRRWLDPLLHGRAVRRDTVRLLRSIRADRGLLERVAGSLAALGTPSLVVWATEDRVMPVEHGRRLGALIGAEVVEIADSYTLLPLDRPRELAAVLRGFVRDTTTGSAADGTTRRR